ncbi:MAG: hypothetical protein U1E46_13370 [Hyphomicrobiales bacterium]
MRHSIRLAALALAGALSMAGPGPFVPQPAMASIYDANLGKIQMTAAQKSKVNSIIAKSNREREAIFKKYGINEHAKPNISKLQRASGELTALGNRERAALAKVLNPTQLRQYDQAISQVRRNVVRAAD